MKKVLLVTAASLVALNAAGCAFVGKGKTPPPVAPAPAPIVTRG